MNKGYLAVGHGRENNGTFDPGAVAGPVREYDLAFKVCQIAGETMEQYKINFFTETAGGPSHDPDYVGSARAVNSGHYDWALEVHFDWSGAPRGGFGLYVSAAGLHWAEMVTQEYEARGLTTRPNDHRADLYLLNSTRCPALIWECDRVGPDVTNDDLIHYGTAIGVGTVRWLQAQGLYVSNDPLPQAPVSPAPGAPVQPAPVPQPPGPQPGQPASPVAPVDRPDSRPARAYPGHLLSPGSSDVANVRAVQQRLHDLGYGLTVDGSYGPQTRGIVVDFQRDQGLQQDGVVGPATWGRLFK